MKATVKILLMLLCLLLAVSATACNISFSDSLQDSDPALDSDSMPDTNPNPNPEQESKPKPEWVSTGAQVTVLNSKAPEKSLILYSDGLLSEAENLKSVLTAAEIRGVKITSSDTESAEYRIILGESDCEASHAAKALYTEAKKKAPKDLHWALAYYNGDLALYAESELGYEKAISDLVSKNINLGKLTVRDDLSSTGVFTAAQSKELSELLAREEELLKSNSSKIDSLLSLLEAQRKELKSHKGKISKNKTSDPDILLFQSYTENIGKSPWGAPPLSPSEDHPRLLINSSVIPEIKKSLRADDKNAAFFATLVGTELPNGAILDYISPSSNSHNLNYEYLEVIQAKALAYAVYGDPYYGYQAIYYMKNILKSLDIQYIGGDQCRDYGYVMLTAALVYDWCYDLLTKADKTQFIAGVENCLCRGTNATDYKMGAVGFPPSGLNPIASYACEYIILRDYLSFAIAIYGDNDSWWNYIGGRVYNELIPAHNHYLQSGIAPQGTGTYITARFVGDIYAAWMLRVAVGENPYVNMESVLRSCMSYEITPHRLFNDGDGGGDSVDGFRFMDIAYMSAYLFGDTTMLAQADFLLGEQAISCKIHRKSYMGISNPIYMALSGLCDIAPKENRFEDMKLICYNGSPLGQYVVHTSWDHTESVSLFMRMRERTTANHDHADAGTFEIYYKGMLSSDGGMYDSYSHNHTRFFHQATISHNGLIIYNPSKASEDNGWYSGGQRGVRAGASSLDEWLTDPTMSTGKIIGHQAAYTDDKETAPLYAYIAGDITDAYPSDTVSYVGRRMLSVFTGDSEFPLTLFVFDDITAKSASYEKRFLLQISSKTAPTIDTKNQTVITENGGGRLVLTCLSDDVKLVGVGGRNEGRYNATASRNYLINGKQLATKTPTADDGHWGRVEIVHIGKSANSTFMNVLYVTDSGNENRAAVEHIANAKGLVGGVFDGKIAGLFATSRTGAEKTVSCTVPGDGELDYYVSGVAEGSWRVKVDGETVGKFEATAEGGLLTFTAPAGKVVISPVK